MYETGLVEFEFDGPLFDVTAPRLTARTRHTPAASPTNTDSLIWRLQFDEDVTGVDAGDFAVTGTTAKVSNVTVVSADTYDITVSGGDLENLNATVGLGFAPGFTIEDANGNALTDTTPTGTDEASWSVINDSEPPAAPSIPDLAAASDSGVSDSDNETNIARPVFTGTAEAEATVELFIGGQLAGTGTATGGNWSIPLTRDLVEGANIVTARATDVARNTGEMSDAVAVVLDQTAPAAPRALELDAASDTGTSSSDRITREAQPLVHVVARFDDRVFLHSGELTLASGPTGETGVGGLRPATPLADGVYTLTGIASDAAGNVSPPSSPLSLTIDTAPPAGFTVQMDGTVTADNLTSSTARIVSAASGLAFAYTLTSDQGGSVSGAGTTGDSPHVFTLPDLSGLSDGDLTLSAVLSDTAGNDSAAQTSISIKDVSTPAQTNAPALLAEDDTGASNADAVTSVYRPRFEGSGEAGTTAWLYVDGQRTQSARVGNDGRWLFEDQDRFSDGTYSLTVRAQNRAGTFGPDSSALTLVVDTQAPEAPALPDLAEASDTGDSSSDNITATARPEIGGSAVGIHSVEVRLDGVSTGTHTVSGNAWSWQPGSNLAEGVHTVAARFTDLAGNTGAWSSDLSLTRLVAAPATPPAPVLDPNQDLGAVAGDNVLNSATPRVQGTGAPVGTTLIIARDGVEAGTVRVSETGQWSYDFATIVDGQYDITARARDVAGNLGAVSGALSLTVDTERPTGQFRRLRTAPGSGLATVELSFSERVYIGTSGGSVADPNYFTVRNGNLVGDIELTSPTTLRAEIRPDENGDIEITAGRYLVWDLAGNDLVEVSFTTPFDDERPTISLSASQNGPVSGAFDLTIQFSEPVLGFERTDLQITNASTSGFTGSDDRYQLTLMPAVDGEVRVEIAEGVAEDAAENTSLAATPFTVMADLTRPTVALSGPDGPVAEAFSVVVSFSEPVTGFAAGDLVVGNGTVTGFSGSDANYSVEITPAGSGVVSVSLAADVAEDAAGNGNDAGAFSVEADLTAPSATLALGASGVVAGPFAVSISFSEAVTGLSAAALSVSNGVVTSLSGEGASWSAQITPADSGAVSVSLGAGVTTDAAGNGNTAADPVSVEADMSAPQVSLSTSADEPVTGAFSVQIQFSEPVTGFGAGSIAVGNGSVSEVSGSGTDYAATIIPAGEGNVTVSVNAGAGQDEAGNASAASATLTLSADPVAPGVSVTSAVSEPVSGAFTVTITFTEPVEGFALSDITVTNGAASNLSGSGAQFSADITPAADGAVTVEIPAGGVEDVAGNANTASGALSIEHDATAPGVVISADVSDVVSGGFAITITFTEPVEGFELAAVEVTGGAASNLAGDGAYFTADITADGDGEVSVAIPAGVAQDAAGNANTAAQPFTIQSDATAPGVVISSYVSDVVSGGFAITITFTEPVEGFELAAIEVTGGAASNLAGDGAHFTADITADGDGEVSVAIPAGVALDAAGNANTASAPFAIQSDATAPGVVISSDQSGSVSGAVRMTLTFTEPVSGMTLEALSVENASVSDLTGEGAVYGFALTPDAEGAVRVSVPAGVVTDLAGNANLASDAFTLAFDATPPEAVITLPGEETEGAFIAEVSFSESVTGFEADDVTITNGALTGLSEAGEGVFTLEVTPDTLGTLTITLAEHAVSDAAGNGNAAVSASLDVVAKPVEVEVVIADSVVEVTEVSADVAITNPGSQEISFRVEIDVSWLAVDPMSGTIPALGDLEFTISVKEQAEALPPGDYTATVTIINETQNTGSGGSSARQASKTANTAQAAEQSLDIVVEIPLSITVQPRNGTLQLVATTPGGVQRDVDANFSSSAEAFDMLTLSTQSGRAISTVETLLQGRYDVRQSLPQGWQIEAITCAGDLDGESLIDLENGHVDIDLDANEAIVCTFQNTRNIEEIRLATQRAIRNFMLRRADRILSEAPDLSRRLRDRATSSPGRFAFDMVPDRQMMAFSTSLSGLRNHAKRSAPQMPTELGVEAGEGTYTGPDIWMSASFSSLSDRRDGAETSSEFGILQVGTDWAFGENMLVGILIQQDWMDEVTDTIAERAGGLRGARVSGSGWMAGPYLVMEPVEGVSLDVLTLWGQSDNTVDPLGLYEDRFETNRFLVRANLSGDLRQGGWAIRPGLALSHFEETQAAYTDALNITIPEQTIAIGRLEAGPELAYRWTTLSGASYEPRIRLRGIWDYATPGLVTETGALTDRTGLRADMDVGLRALIFGKAHLDVSARFSGLGDGAFSANGARVELRMPF